MSDRTAFEKTDGWLGVGLRYRIEIKVRNIPL